MALSNSKSLTRFLVPMLLKPRVLYFPNSEATPPHVKKLENAKILYENSGKTAAEVCEIAGVGRRVFFAYLAKKRSLGG